MHYFKRKENPETDIRKLICFQNLLTSQRCSGCFFFFHVGSYHLHFQRSISCIQISYTKKESDRDCPKSLRCSQVGKTHGIHCLFENNWILAFLSGLSSLDLDMPSALLKIFEHDWIFFSYSLSSGILIFSEPSFTFFNVWECLLSLHWPQQLADKLLNLGVS